MKEHAVTVHARVSPEVGRAVLCCSELRPERAIAVGRTIHCENAGSSVVLSLVGDVNPNRVKPVPGFTDDNLNDLSVLTKVGVASQGMQ